jgi:predicted ATPase
MLREMEAALDALTADLPLVLILEDLHWTDYSTLDLISYLATQRQAAQLMLIGDLSNRGVAFKRPSFESSQAGVARQAAM